jgi:hypothetical protein
MGKPMEPVTDLGNMPEGVDVIGLRNFLIRIYRERPAGDRDNLEKLERGEPIEIRGGQIPDKWARLIGDSEEDGTFHLCGYYELTPDDFIRRADPFYRD